jgi:biopolymer transport protein TolR
MNTGAMDETGGRRRRRSRPPRLESQINVTPFVDLFMVLLVVFIVATPMMTVGVPLRLPKTAATALPIDSEEEPLTVNIDAAGAIFLQREPIAEAELAPRLAAVLAERRSDRVYLRADAGIDYGRVALVMGALNAGGIRNIGLVTDPAPSGGPAAATP